jgi:hypothetical protein
MKVVRTLQFFFVAALLCMAFTPRANADDWNKETKITTSETLEIPGHVLPPGTYIFKLAENGSYRHIVQVWTGDKTFLIATVFTVPVYRDDVTDEPVFELNERPGNSPEAIRAWYYPGEHTGSEFTYPRSEFRSYSASLNPLR